MILSCTCTHPVQDKFHGKGRRVHNVMTRTVSGLKYRCTVCKNEREAFSSIFTPTPVAEPKKGGIK